MRFGLVIFDCDGVLVDSEIISCREHAELLTELGYPISAEQVFERFLGRATHDTSREVEAELGRSLPSDFIAQLKIRLDAAFAASLRAVPHLEAALDALERPFCVASSGTPDKIATSLRLVGLGHRFAARIFSATEVARGKPAPDLFLLAARRMAVEPERCLVIEDSVPGVLGARAAGMTVLGYCGGSHCRPDHAAALTAAGAAASFDDMRQLSDLIEQLELCQA
uniref:HAD-superfamily hydrolase, subfamily IA, variant 3 n=1 Tax=Rhodopseudomonas palustris (strain BisA53) TaxID=316055 RepID=Q07V67_RHOP5